MRTLMAALLMLLAMPAGAQQWVEVARSGQLVVYYLDPTSILVRDSLRRFVTISDYAAFLPLNGGLARSGRSLMELDCKEGRSRRLTLTFFDDQMGSGRALGTINEAEAWSFVEPKAPNAHILQVVCAVKE